MFNYIRGTITDIESSYVVVDNSDVGYQIFVPNPYSYKVDNKYKIYIYNHIKEDEYSLYGFQNKEEYDMFIKLISVKGLGPKMALPILATGSIGGIVDAIERENILYLKKFPKIGDKVAKQIILDLKGKFKGINIDSKVNETSEELVEALLALGYRNADIKKILNKIDSSKTIEEQIKEALKLLLKS